jgi:hypothetical protein
MAFGSLTSYRKDVTTSGSPPRAVIPRSEHRIERVNFVGTMVLGTSPTPVSVNILANGDVEIYTGAAATVRVIIS